MSAPFEFDVFLSHSSKDKPVVQALAERLRAAGLKVWFDAWEIRIGDSIFAKIEHGLEHSHKLLLCMSANAFESDWATLEQQTRRFRDPQNRERSFIPLKLDDTPPKGTLAGFKYLDWRTPTDEAFQTLVEACQLVPASAPPAAPLPPMPGHPDFASFATSWPYANTGLQLEFIDEAKQAISTAQCAPSHEDCTDCVLRITSEQSGLLVLFYQSSDGSFMQMLPNSDPASNASISAGVHDLPGNLLPLPCTTLGPNAKRIHFTAPGSETALAFLLPTLPACIIPRTPLFDLDADSMRTILQTLHGMRDAKMAVASIHVLAKK
jgi:TIR domain